MICYKCDRVTDCPHVRYIFQNNISIDGCKEFSLNKSFKYTKIANNEHLMLLIYNYFIEEEELFSMYTKEEIENKIKKVINGL